MTKQTSKKPETIEEYKDKLGEVLRLLIEARDALPAISLASAKLRGIDLTLADRIEEAMKPWEISQ